MKKGLIRIFFLLLAALIAVQPLRAAQKPTLLFYDPRPVEISPSSQTGAVVTGAAPVLLNALKARGPFTVVTAAESDPVPKTESARLETARKSGAEFLLTTRLFQFEDRLIAAARLVETAGGAVRFEDQVYTYNLSNSTGLSNALETLADRMTDHMNGLIVPVFRGELPPGETANWETNGATVSLPGKKSEQLRKLTVAGLSYAFPTGFELDFLSGFYCRVHPDLRFGIGAGTGLARVFLNDPAQTNITGTLFPLRLHVPVWTHPASDRVLDILFTTEWAWYSPFQVSGGATNTNANSFLDRPLRYLDFHLTFYFLPFASATAGMQWQYEISQVRFYAGVGAFLGFYAKD